MIRIRFFKSGTIDQAIEFPETWNELDTPELITIAKVMLSDTEDLFAAQSIILLELLKYRGKLNGISTNIIQLLDPEDLFIQGIPLTEFIYKDIQLTRQPYPILKLRTKFNGLLHITLRGPVDNFENITAGEYELAEINFLQYAQTPEKIFLAKLAAVLYRPAGKDLITFNAPNNQYHEYDHEAIVKYFLKLDAPSLFVIYMWYVGNRRMLPLMFPTLHETDDQSTTQDLLIFTKCIHSAAGPKNGSREKVRRTLLKALLFEMELEAVKAKEIKASYDKQ